MLVLGNSAASLVAQTLALPVAGAIAAAVAWRRKQPADRAGSRQGYAWWNNKWKGGRGVVLALSLVLIFLVSSSLDKYLMTAPVDSGSVSTVCKEAGVQCSEGEVSGCCSPNQWKKFLWFMVDGMAIDQATEALTALGDHADYYRVLNNRYKNSFVAYTSFFTGKVPGNFAGKLIENDNLFQQMHSAGYDVVLTGAQEPMLDIVKRDFFSMVELYEDEQRLYERVFAADEPAPADVATYLDGVTEGGDRSVFFASNFLDHLNHKYSKTGAETKEAVQHVTAGLVAVKQWVDAHPEYVLMVTSDHGGDTYVGESAVTLHGPKDGGNECFVMMYNPSIEPVTQGDWIDIVDVCGTITQYLAGVSIPYESVGVLKPKSTDADVQLALYKRQAAQMVALAHEVDVAVDEAGLRAAQAADTDGNAAVAAETYHAFMVGLKEKLVSNMPLPFWSITFLGLCVAAAQAILYDHNFGTSDGFVASIKSLFVATVFPAWFLYFMTEFPWWNAQTVVDAYWVLAVGTMFHLCVRVAMSAGTYLPLMSTEDIKDSDRESEPPTPAPSDQRESVYNRGAGAAARYLLYTVVLLFLPTMGGTFASFVRGRLVVDNPLLPYFNYALAAYLLAKEMREHARCAGMESEARHANMRGAFYAALLVCSALFEVTGVAWLCRPIYYGVLLDVVVCLTSARRDQRLMLVPLTILLFFVARTPAARLYLLLCIVLPYHFLTSLYHTLPVTRQDPTLFNQFRRMVLLCVFVLTLWHFFHLGFVFDMNLDVHIPGIANVEAEPILTGLLMGIRKFSVYFLQLAALLRLTTRPEAEKLTHQSTYTTLRFYVFHELVLATVFLLWVFHKNLSSLRNYDVYFICGTVWAINAIGYGMAFVLEGTLPLAVARLRKRSG